MDSPRSDREVGSFVTISDRKKSDLTSLVRDVKALKKGFSMIGGGGSFSDLLRETYTKQLVKNNKKTTILKRFKKFVCN